MSQELWVLLQLHQQTQMLQGQVVAQLSGDPKKGAVGTQRTATAQLHTLVAQSQGPLLPNLLKTS